MKYVLALIRFILLFLIITVYYGVYRLTLLVSNHNVARGFNLRRFVLQSVNPVLGFRIEKALNYADEPALYVCNHRGLLDFFIVLRYVDAFVVSKAEVKNIPIFASAASYTGIIFVDRQSKESRGATRRAIIETLGRGGNVLIFPEGTTNIAQTTMDFKPGAFEEVASHGFPVVPIALEYKTPRDYWKNISTFQMFVSQFGKWTTHAKLHFGPVIKSDDSKILQERSRDWIDNELIEMQKDWSQVKY
jgi:1-acyl-sn-glycerol-3-phosphate acyltransferase